MTVYCGVDFHARQQTVCYCDSAGGELRLAELDHARDDVGGFYSALAGEGVVGIEASGYSAWFIEMLEGLGHQVLIGDAAEIRRLARRRQKNDRRDAGLMLDLLLKGEFPQVHRPPSESREVLRLLRYRHKLVQMRTRAKNSLQALAFSAGSSGRSRLLSREGRERFLRLPMGEAMARQRAEWLSLVDEFNARIKSLDSWLDKQARREERVLRLQTHPLMEFATRHVTTAPVVLLCSRNITTYYFARRLARALRLDERHTTARLEDLAAEKLKRYPRPIFIDQANYLDEKALGLICYLWEVARIPVVLAGTKDLYDLFTTSRLTEGVRAQLSSRVALHYLLAELSLPEGKAIIKRALGGLATDEVVAKIYNVTGGIHRHVDMIMPRILELMERNKEKLEAGEITIIDIILIAGSRLITG